MIVLLYAAFPELELSMFSFIFAGSRGGTSGMCQLLSLGLGSPTSKRFRLSAQDLMKHGRGLVAEEDEFWPLWGPAEVCSVPISCWCELAARDLGTFSWGPLPPLRPNTDHGWLSSG